MDLATYLTDQEPQMAPQDARRFSRLWRTRLAAKGQDLVVQGAASTAEYILLTGCAASVITDVQGRAACIGLHRAPCVLPPQLSRTREGLSFVTIEILDEALVAEMSAQVLSDAILEDLAVREWANTVLRQELARKADREWCLSALGGAERLTWFRDRYPGAEETMPHTRIAAFLGMTPVSFSRLRKAAPAE